MADDEAKLFEACNERDLDTIKLLVEKGANVNAKKLGWTLMEFCCVSGYCEIVEYLLSQKANPNSEVKKNWGSLHSAVHSNCQELVKLLLDNRVNPDDQDLTGTTPLHRACDNGRHSLVEMLILSKADVNMTDIHGNTPYDVCNNRQTKLAFDDALDELSKIPVKRAKAGN